MASETGVTDLTDLKRVQDLSYSPMTLLDRLRTSEAFSGKTINRQANTLAEVFTNLVTRIDSSVPGTTK